MDSKQRTLLTTAVAILKGNTKKDEEISWEGILTYLELTTADYLELGRIW